MKKILNHTALYIKKHRASALPGLILFSILFLLSNYLNFSSTYMGNKIDSALNIIYEHYLPEIILLFIKILAVYLAAGLITGIVFFRACAELIKRFPFFNGRLSRFVLSIAGPTVFTFLIFSGSIIRNPQIYAESFEANTPILALYQRFLTNNFPPCAFDIPLYILSAAAILLFIISFNWKNVCETIVRKYNSLKFKKRVSAAAVILCALCLVLIIIKPDINKDKNRPNILIIASDALRPDHFSCNGYFRDTTPNIDRIAEGALQAKRVITTVPRTFPAWVSILTSSYPLSSGIEHMFPRTRSRNINFNTAVKHLKSLGYAASVVSDFGGDIFPRFEFGFENTLAPDITFPVVLKQIIIERQVFLLPFIINSIGQAIFPEMRGLAKLSIPEALTDEAIGQIESSGGRPFFIAVFHSITHFPFSAPHPYYKKYSDPGYSGPCKYLKQRVLTIGSGPSGENVSADDEAQVVALYDGCLNLFDREAGRLFDYLRESAVLDNTIVIITSDHGENLYEPGLGLGHGEHLKSDYPLAVPLFIYSKNLRHMKGQTTDGPSSIIDIMPTVYDIAGLDAPGFFEGRSILKKFSMAKNKNQNIVFSPVEAYAETGMWFDNDKNSPLFFHRMRIDYPDITGVSEIDFSFRDEIVIQQRYQNIVNGSKYRAIYSSPYKLIYIPQKGGPVFELYNFINDPDNKNDLSKNEARTLSIMKNKFYAFIDDKSAGNYLIRGGIIIPAFRDPLF